MKRLLAGNTRKRSAIISIAGGVALLLLALSVFAVASQARSLQTQAERSVRAVENLRVVALARSELSVASRLAEAAPEEVLVIDGAIENSLVRLDEVESNLDAGGTNAVGPAFIEFRAAVDAQIAQINESTDDREALRNAEFATGEAFAALAEVMRAEQTDSFAELEADNDLMNLIAAIATFVVAFVVPSAGLFIFQALRTAPRELRRARLERDQTASRSTAMADAISSEASELRAALKDGPKTELQQRLSRSMLRFEQIAAFNGAPTSIRNEKMDINKAIAHAVEQVAAGASVQFRPREAAHAFADPDQFTLVVSELITNALTHGSAPVQIAVQQSSGGIEVHVIDRGRGLRDSVPEALLHEQEFGLREDTGTGAYGFGLITARRALEAMGGGLRYARNGELTHMIARVPMTAANSSEQAASMPRAA